MKDRLISAVYELKDEIIIRADTTEVIQKALEALKRIDVPYHDSYKIKEPYFIRLITINAKTGEAETDGQWLDRPEIIAEIAENTGAEIVTASGRSFRELAEDKNREVEEYRTILRAHKEAIDHIIAFGFSNYAYAQKDIISTQSMLTLAIRLTQIEEDLSDIASVLHRMADTASETNNQHTKKER